MMHDTDIALVQRFAAVGDAEAFTEIVNRYGGFVYSICRRILRDQARAQDASQNTFFQLLRNPQKVTESLSGWLHTVATRTAIDVVRQDSSRQEREKEYASVKSVKAHNRWEDVSPHIDEALAELPEASRAILVNHFLVGRTEKDLAVELGVSQPTVSRKKKKALSELREKLGKKGVLVGIGALGTLLLSAASEAAPAALLAELGKMAMLSGWKLQIGANASNKSSTVGGTGISGSRDSVIATTAVTLAAIAGILGFFDILRFKPLLSGMDRTVIVAEDGNVSRENGVSGKDKVFALHTTTVDGTAESDMKDLSHTVQPLKTTDKTIDINKMLDAHQSQIALDLNEFKRPDPGVTIGDQEVLTVGKGMSTEDTLKQGIVGLPYSALTGVWSTTFMTGGERGVFVDYGNVEFTITGPLGNRRIVKTPPPAYPAWADEQGLRGNLKLSAKVGRDGKTVGTIVIISTTGYPDWDNAVVERVKSEWLWKESSGTTPGQISFDFIPEPRMHREKKNNTKGKGRSTEDTLYQDLVALSTATLKGTRVGLFTTRGAGVSGSGGKVRIDTAPVDFEERKTEFKEVVKKVSEKKRRSKGVEAEIFGSLAERKLLNSPLPAYPDWAEEQGTCGNLKLSAKVGRDGKTVGTIVIISTTGYPEWDNAVVEWVKKEWSWEKSSRTTPGQIGFNFVPNPRVHEKKGNGQ